MEKVLLVANSFAGSVSERAREVIVKALSADCRIEVQETTRRDHASDLAREAVSNGFGSVIAFGGDGTINEVAQGLVGTDVALGILPGGSTNVMARSLGLPRDPIEATAVVGAALRSRARRKINVGRINDRYFLFSAGMGLDAQVVKDWEAHPEWRGSHHDYHFLKAALKAGATQYRAADPSITLEVEGADPVRVVLAICCNGRPFTYFKRWPVDVCPQARLDGGLDFFAIDRIRTSTIPRIIWSVFVSRSHVGWKHSHYHHDVSKGRMTADAPLPVQVDGDYIGEHDSAEITSIPGSLSLLA